ncbi:MAG: NADH-quinone oxidoreductase subunit NuoH [Planctomycetota bacterium]|nr:NADH-quinone oxidoreductase subunit NuoH [Planctomycetota bacterium]
MGRIGLVLLLVHVLLIVGALMVWAERRVSAWMQDRLGPNRVGPEGLLQPLADLGKFMFKEDVVPKHTSKWMYMLAPAISLVPAMVTFAVIPFTGSYEPIYGADGQPTGEYITQSWQIADLNIGVLYILAIASLGVYGVTLGGWASNSKYSLLGGVRASAQMISYELSLGLAVVPVVLMVSSLRLGDIIAYQADTVWLLFTQPVAFFIFLVASYAETNRLPFDMPESETELVAGYHTEYSSMKFALFFLAEYTHMIVGAALVVTLFCGGWTFFGLEQLGWIMGVLIFAAKTTFFLFAFIWVRWTLPRFRYDQLMALGWAWFLPIALLNIVLTGGALAFDQDWVLYILPVALIAAAVIAAWFKYRRDLDNDVPKLERAPQLVGVAGSGGEER